MAFNLETLQVISSIYDSCDIDIIDIMISLSGVSQCLFSIYVLEASLLLEIVYIIGFCRIQ